ncbi:TrkH family potassium uptake protein [Sanguibacter antarcticus]|uniref:Potassium uptake TrkH family protein n=1 Tax=Sanguibacter antarcticus TaxID=372484 RepID=A0A2A9E7G1_9MICO|nr:potassium transporter TrkG [Sanguibacter antarcticus]PFG34898.1 potassium uptake TrkH family protein [Sanguibacter antarcticus]
MSPLDQLPRGRPGRGLRRSRRPGVTPDAGIRRRPGQVLVGSFAAAIAVGTLLLLLPVSSAGRGATVLEALFTATSAVCVTGLVVVDTATFWTPFGQAVVMLLFQVGGFGIMTLASLLGLLLSRRLGLRSRLVGASATSTVSLGDLRRVLLGIGTVTVVVEGTTAAVLAARFVHTYGEPVGRAAWLGLFHAVSAFNNAGFALYTDNLMGFVTDPWVCLPIAAAVVVGGIGFPVLLEVWRSPRRPRAWSLHTKISVMMTAVLITAGTVFMTLAEWSNPATLGPLDVRGKVLAGFFQGVSPRTAGFNSIDIAQMDSATWLGSDVLMFIGGGSGGTAGGIKITTFTVLLVVIWAELRGDPDATLFDRRIAVSAQRQALAVALLGVAAVLVSTIVIAMTSPFTSDQVLYEVVSAFATVGLSTGITAQLDSWHQVILCALMFVGRLGPVTLGTALALRSKQRLVRMPESAPIVG